MVKRRAVGATLVSALLFSSLVVSNLVLLTSAEAGESASSLADGESSVYASAKVLQGVTSFELVAEAQAALSSRTYLCSSAVDDARSRISGLSVSSESGGVSAVATVLPDPAGTAPDNLSMVGEYDGGHADRFSFPVLTTEDGSTPGGRVDYDKVELHVLNLPFDPSAAPGFCMAALADLASVLLPLLAGACNGSLVYARAQATGAALEGDAVGKGLHASVTVDVAAGPPCSAAVRVSVEQRAIDGPGGPFTWAVAEGEQLP